MRTVARKSCIVESCPHYVEFGGLTQDLQIASKFRNESEGEISHLSSTLATKTYGFGRTGIGFHLKGGSSKKCFAGPASLDHEVVDVPTVECFVIVIEPREI